MEVITRQAATGDERAAALRLRLRVRQRVYVRDLTIPLPQRGAREWHNYLVGLLHRYSISALRLMLGLIFLWFGVLKLFGASPVMGILRQTFSFLPVEPLALALGAWEVLLGVGLIARRALRCTLGLLCLHLAGTFATPLLAPALFFHDGNPLWLTVEGEFVMKNVVLIAAGLVIGGHEVEPLGGLVKADSHPANGGGRVGGTPASLSESGDASAA